MISPTRRFSFRRKLAASLAMVVVLPTPVGPTSAARRQRPGVTWIGPATRMSSSIMPATWALSIIGSERPSACGSLRTPLDQFAGQLFAQFGVEQIGEQAEQFLGPVVVAGAFRVPAEVLHHRLQRAELALHLMRQPRLVDGRASRRFVRRRRFDDRLLLHCRASRQTARHVDAARGGHFDLSRARQQAEPTVPRTSRVCSTAASGPSSRRTSAKASCIVAAR